MSVDENGISENKDSELNTMLKKLLTDFNKREESKIKNIRIASFMKILFFGVVILSFCLFYLPFVLKFHSMGEDERLPKGTVNVVKLNKQIGNGNRMINSEVFNKMLKKAYDNGDAKGVVLYMNSPGGSPVESDVMYKRIEHYKEKYPHIKIVSVIQEVCASGCYYVASATDKIYASETSMIGSIGVIMSGFGFNESIEKLGIERRVFTAGKSKSFLDPFSEINKESKEHIKTLLAGTHKIFKERVVNGRGDRLRNDKYDDIFTGLVWLADDAKDRGLIDSKGNMFDVVEKEFGSEKFYYLNENKRGLLNLLSIKATDSILSALSEIRSDENMSLQYK